MALSVFRGGPAFGEAGAFCGLRSYPMLLEQKAGKTQRCELFENRNSCEAVSTANPTPRARGPRDNLAKRGAASKTPKLPLDVR